MHEASESSECMKQVMKVYTACIMCTACITQAGLTRKGPTRLPCMRKGSYMGAKAPAICAATERVRARETTCSTTAEYRGTRRQSAPGIDASAGAPRRGRSATSSARRCGGGSRGSGASTPALFSDLAGASRLFWVAQQRGVCCLT